MKSKAKGRKSRFNCTDDSNHQYRMQGMCFYKFILRAEVVKAFLFWATILILFFFFINKAGAQVVINEFSSSTSSDWIEFHGYEDTEISGWVIDDYGTSSNVKVFEEGTFIGPSYKSFLVVGVSSRLNKNGDIITLYDSNGNVIDEISYGDKGGVCIPTEAGSIGRYPDAGSVIERFREHSYGASNNLSELDPCPTPTSIPTNIPIPTTTPKPTPTPVPTFTLTPTLAPTKPKTSTPTPLGKNLEEKQILGMKETEMAIVNDDAEISDKKESKNPIPLAAGVFILAGLGLMGFPVANYFRLKRGYNQKDGQE